LDGMDTYLLLRSNKQSGPYTFQQLVNFGLKPYDLVWVEGKSAAWRYPSEVDGLKAYAPSTEEQPFDRFYKKSEEKSIKTPSEKPEEKPQEKVMARPVEKQEAPVEKQEEIVAPPADARVAASKKVFVSMPVNTTAKKQVQNFTATSTNPVFEPKPMIKEETIEPKKVETKPIPITEETYEPIIKEKKVIKEEPVLSEKYSESLDDIKKRYTETYLTRKKRSGWTSTHTSIAQVFGGAIFFCFLVVVVYKNFSGDESTQLSRTTVIQPDKRSVNKTSDQTPANTAATLPVTTKETTKPKEKKQQPEKNEINPPDESLATIPVLQKNEEAVNASDYSEVANTSEKKIETPKTEEVKPKVRPVNIHKLVNVSANNYKQRAFGGVMNLELTVNNDSKFDIERVIVELQYLKPSEQPIKTEKVVFNSVGAGDSKTLKIPDYLRGVKISYRVLDIASSQYDRQTAGL